MNLISNKEIIAFLIIAGILFISIYAIDPARAPGTWVRHSNGPFEMIIEENSKEDTRSRPAMDHTRYFTTAEILTEGNLNNSTWNGNLGYPILIYPFVSSIHVFLIPNLLLFLGVMYGTLNLSTRFFQDKKLSYVVIIALLFFSGFLFYFVEPQKQHLNEFAFIIIAFILFETKGEIKKWKLLVVGVILGWVVWTNYIDVIYFFPLMIFYFIYKPRKSLTWIFPFIILVGALLFLQYSVFGDPLHVPNTNQSRFVDKAFTDYSPKGQNLEPGVGILSFDPNIIGKRVSCMLFDPMFCVPPPTGNPIVDEEVKQFLNGKRAIIFGMTGFFIFAPYGLVKLFMKFQGYKRYYFIALLSSFIIGAGFWVSIFIWHSGGGPFWRYHMVWYPIVTILSVKGMYDIYQRIFSKNRSFSEKNK